MRKFNVVHAVIIIGALAVAALPGEAKDSPLKGLLAESADKTEAGRPE